MGKYICDSTDVRYISKARALEKGILIMSSTSFILQSSALLCLSHNSFYLYDALATFSMYTN